MTSAPPRPLTEGERKALDEDRAALAAWVAAQADGACAANEEAKQQWLLARSPSADWLKAGKHHVLARDDTGTALPMHRIVGELSASAFLAERLGAPSGADDYTDRAWLYLSRYCRSWMEPLIEQELADTPLERKAHVERELRELCDPEHAFVRGEPRLRLFAQKLYGCKDEPSGEHVSGGGGDSSSAPRALHASWAWCSLLTARVFPPRLH